VLYKGALSTQAEKKVKPQQAEPKKQAEVPAAANKQQPPPQKPAEAMDDDEEEKSREAIKAEREAKKLAKAAAKQASKNKAVDGDAAKPAKVEKPAEKADEAGGKSKAELKAERRAKQEAQRAAKEQQKMQAASGGEWGLDQQLTPHLAIPLEKKSRPFAAENEKKFWKKIFWFHPGQAFDNFNLCVVLGLYSKLEMQWEWHK